MDEWLIRTTKNSIVGPYSKSQVSQMILSGKLALDDEVCPENGYWIFLYERQEVRNQLGIEVPFTTARSDEGGLASTHRDEITAVHLQNTENKSKKKDEPDFSFKFSTEEITETTAILKRVSEEAKAKREQVHSYDPGDELFVNPVESQRKFRRRASVWNVSIWGLSVFIVFLMMAIFYLLNRPE